MIKFFRHIRKKLVGENRFGKYLIYAIGEIVLVVIGILIALQINNWSEYKKNRIAETVLLENILEDLNNDLNILNQAIKSNKSYLSAIDSILYKTSFHKEYSNFEFLKDNLTIPLFNKFLITKGTYIEGLSSGKLSLILSDSLRKSILDYYEVQYNSLGADQMITDMMTKTISDFELYVGNTQEYTQLLGIKADLPKLNIQQISKQNGYRKLLIEKYSYMLFQNNSYQKFIEANKQLIQSIENNLNND